MKRTGRETFRGRLERVRMGLYPLQGRGPRTYHRVMVRPSLGFAMVPRPIEAPEEDDLPPPAGEPDQRTLAFLADRGHLPAALRLSAVAGEAQPEPAGFIEGAKSDADPQKPSRRHGLSGLSAAGGLAVEDFCALIRQDKGQYGMWTVTIPTLAAAMLDKIPDGASKLSDVIRRRFSEKLSRACALERKRTRIRVAPRWAFVIEPQKRGVVHWHFVFRCRSRPGRPWLLSKAQLDQLIRAAIRTVTGVEVPVQSAGNVQKLRSTPGAYLSKYLRKGVRCSAPAVVLRNGWSENMIPRQWWGWSKETRAWVETYRFELPAVLVCFLSRQWRGLAAIGRIRASIWTPPDERAPQCVVGRWNGVQELEEVIQHLALMSGHAYDPT